jgi:hypothetical protein
VLKDFVGNLNTVRSAIFCSEKPFPKKKAPYDFS